MKREDWKKVFPEIKKEQLDAIESALKGEYERGKIEAEEGFKKLEFENKLSDALLKAAAKNVKALKALLDISKLSLENGKIEGLDEQIEQLKKDSGYLFSDGGKKPEFTAPNTQAQKLAEADFQKLSYMKRLQLFRDNPELYNQLSR